MTAGAAAAALLMVEGIVATLQHRTHAAAAGVSMNFWLVVSWRVGSQVEILGVTGAAATWYPEERTKK